MPVMYAALSQQHLRRHLMNPLLTARLLLFANLATQWVPNQQSHRIGQHVRVSQHR